MSPGSGPAGAPVGGSRRGGRGGRGAAPGAGGAAPAASGSISPVSLSGKILKACEFLGPVGDVIGDVVKVPEIYKQAVTTVNEDIGFPEGRKALVGVINAWRHLAQSLTNKAGLAATCLGAYSAIKFVANRYVLSTYTNQNIYPPSDFEQVGHRYGMYAVAFLCLWPIGEAVIKKVISKFDK